MRRPFLVFCLILVVGSLCLAKDHKIHGFVTSIASPISFDIDDYRITSDNTLSLEVEKDSDDDAVSSFKPEDIRVGSELEIKGDYDESTGVLTAKSIKVFLNDTRKIKRTALIEQIPSLQKTDAGWIGTVSADGQRISIVPSTVVSYKLNQSERKQAKRAKSEKEDTRSLPSADLITLDTFMHYEGIRQPDGSILAKKIDFQHAELENGEAKMWRSLTPKVKEPNYSSFRPGEIRVEKQKYKVVPNKEAQDYIAKFGETLIPRHQKDLSPDNPLKIPFRFYLVQDKAFNAAAYPNGTVIVHSGVFAVAENEAQLAFILSHEISHAIEKHSWREHEYHKKALTALRIGGAVAAGFGANGRAISDMATLVEAAIRNGYARSNENQADRVGLEWMLESGYDIREAPQSWKAVARKYGDRRTNLFWDNHDNNTTRRSYLMSEIKNNYSDVDFSGLKKDSEQFHRIAEAVTASEGRKTKIKLRVPKPGASDIAAQQGKSTATTKTGALSVDATKPGTRAGQNDNPRPVKPEPISTEQARVIASPLPEPPHVDAPPASTTLASAGRNNERVRAQPPNTVNTGETDDKPLGVYPFAVDNSGQLSRWSTSTAPSGPETWWQLAPSDPGLKISLSSTSVFFPKQSVLSQSPLTQIIIRNEDSSVVKLPALVISGTDAADFAASSTCLETLEPEASCTASVSFRPSGIGTRTAILAIGVSHKLSLTGIGN